MQGFIDRLGRIVIIFQLTTEVFVIRRHIKMAMAGEAKLTKMPVVEICEAGLVKFLIPLFHNK